MNQKLSPSQLRANQVWQRFVGLFGGDAVARKYGDSPPAEWVGILTQVNDYQLERGMRRLVHSGRGHVPALPEFMRMCREVANDADEPQSAPQITHDNGWRGDAWDIAANFHLLKHTAAHVLPNDSELPAKVAKRVAAKNAWASDMRDMAANHGGTVPVATQRAIWADYMRGVA